MKGQLQKTFDESLRNVPRMFLSKMIEKKLVEVDIKPSRKLVAKLTDATMAGNGDSISWEGDGSDRDVVISFTENDLKEFSESTRKFLKNDIRQLVGDLTRSSARSIVRTLKQNWPEQYAWQQEVKEGFQGRLEARWHEGLTLLRMLLTISREVGYEAHNKRRRSRAKKNRHRDDVLIRLHARACRVGDEIISLLQIGHADGAMARWRTLHEISVIITLIADNDNDLAHRYLAHDFVESKRALSDYMETHASLGYKPPAKHQISKVEKHYRIVLQEFGPEMAKEYGWAIKLFKQRPKRLTFANLEAAAGKSNIRAHYKMACQNVHAGTKGITNQLGMLAGTPVILAGASNAGLDEPGQNTAITLTQITFALFGPRWILDDLVAMSVLTDLQREAIDAFVRVGRRLKREETARTRKKK